MTTLMQRVRRAPNLALLKQRRKEAGMTQKGLADALGVHPGTIYRLEAGQSASYEVFTSACRLLGIGTRQAFLRRKEMP